MKKYSIAYPYLLWMLIFTIIPLFLVILYSFTAANGGTMHFTIENYTRAFETIYIKVFARSIILAAMSTLICLILGYPVAYILASRNFDVKPTTMFLFLMPMWINALLRTYAWVSLIEKNGIINTILGFFGLPGINMIYTEQAVLLGMVYNFIPFMILPIYTVLKKMDYGIIEAAQDLGSHPFYTFIHVIVPLSMPGVISGITMVFMPAVTTFVIPELLGGGKYMLVGSLIEQQFLKLSDKHFGSSISVILLLIIILSMMTISKDEEGGGLF